MRPIRHKAFTDASNGATCIRCGRFGAYACHYNGVRQMSYGKGIGQKCNDLLTAEFCHDCDLIFSEGQRVDTWDSKWERSEEWMHWINMTNVRRLSRGDLEMTGMRGQKMNAASKNRLNHGTEHQHQAALIRWAQCSTIAYPDLKWLFAVPNGGLRDVRVAVKLKAEGVRAGVPDLLFPVPKGGYIGLAIEMKTNAGKLSGAQKEWLDGLESLGWRVEVCRGWESAKHVIIDYMAGITKGA